MKHKASAVAATVVKPHPRAQGHRKRTIHRYTLKQRATIVIIIFIGAYAVGYILHLHELTKGLDALLAVGTDRFLRDGE